MDHATGSIYLDRMLFTATRYPADYGFIEGTMGEDGDPLDALVLVGEPTFPGCRILARPIGVFGMRDEKGQDDKILCVPLRDPASSHLLGLGDLRHTLLAEIEHFFAVYKDLEDKKVETQGFQDLEAALVIIDEARQRAAERLIRVGRCDSYDRCGLIREICQRECAPLVDGRCRLCQPTNFGSSHR